MMKLLKKYGLELKYKKCDLYRFLEGQKEVFVEDGFTIKMTNEEEMFKYEVVLNSIFNKNKIEEEYKRFAYETQDAIQYLNYEEKQKMFNSILSDVLKELKLMKYEDQIIMIPHLEPFINERYLKNYMLMTLKQHKLYVKEYPRDIEQPYQLYGLIVLRSAFSSLKGIGRWTAEMILLFCLKRKNIFSYDDLAIQRGIKMIYHHKKITKDLFEKYRRRFSPYYSVASLYIWHVSGNRYKDIKLDKNGFVIYK